jgi:hypothetical protein
MSERLTHSKLAVASTILPLAVWLYLGLMLGLILRQRAFWRFVDWIFSDIGVDGLLVVTLLAVILFGLIPIAGHIAGAICGIIGLFSKDKKRFFSVIGLVLSVLPLAVGLILYVSGYDFEF